MSNKEILTAVLIEWLKPVIPDLIGSKINSIPVLSMFQNWVRNMGIAPANWTVAQDIAPLIQGGAYDLIAPVILPKLKDIPDEYIPQMAHGVVNSAIQMGGYNLMGGYITFNAQDLTELKNYLDCNLPYTPKERYVVIKPNAGGENSNNPQIVNDKL